VRPEATSVARSFAGCVGNDTYENCLRRGAQDLAWTPLEASYVASIAPWVLCSTEPTVPNVTILGYGRNRTVVPHALLEGAFVLDRQFDALFFARGLGEQMVNIGDSGGPVISASDDSAMATRPPAICFTTAAFVDGPGVGSASRRAILQPAWNLSERLSRELH
jgi:hypothetical protein